MESAADAKDVVLYQVGGICGGFRFEKAVAACSMQDTSAYGCTQGFQAWPGLPKCFRIPAAKEIPHVISVYASFGCSRDCLDKLLAKCIHI